ncbi:MAG: SEL1-like repeat protein [Acidaminococcaceae bacterium]|nr:SEL1-like repeat protein [Acidaminococcaceae bacterium]
MLIQLIIFLTKTKIFASEINGSGKAESISIKGNSEIRCEGKESIVELIECLYDAYNIDDLADDNFDIVIVEAGADREIINFLWEKCKGAAKLNIISIEKLLPVIVSNKNLVQSGEEISVTFADLFYKISCDENSVIKVGKARKNEDAIALSENDFACLYRFTASGVTSVVDEAKLDEAREEIAALQRKLSSYETKLEELREVQKQFVALQESQNKLEKEKEQADEIYLKAKKWQDDGNYKKAFELYQKAADMGSMDAVAGLGWCYYNGNGVEKDLEKALEYNSEAADAGVARAQNVLGVMYDLGEGVNKNKVKAAELYRLAANKGDANAQCNLGYMYEDGVGVPQDFAQAVEWYRKAAEQGLARGQCNLGRMYRNGDGVAQNFDEAMKWFLKGAAQDDARSLTFVGWMYYHGEGVAQDYGTAHSWFLKAAEHDYDWAQYNIGWDYENGQGVEQNRQKAYEWYKKAADQGYEDAKKKLSSSFAGYESVGAFSSIFSALGHMG